MILSGQVGKREDGSVPEDPLVQLEIALDNIARNLRAADMNVTDIVKRTFYLVGEMDAVKRRDVIAAKLGDHNPCMTLLYVNALAAPICKVEIDAWGSRDQE